MKRKKKTSLLKRGWIRQWREKGGFRERESNIFLDFPAFGPSDPSEPRGKVALRCKGYMWTPILFSFDNSGR